MHLVLNLPLDEYLRTNMAITPQSSFHIHWRKKYDILKDKFIVLQIHVTGSLSLHE